MQKTGLQADKLSVSVTIDGLTYTASSNGVVYSEEFPNGKHCKIDLNDPGQFMELVRTIQLEMCLSKPPEENA